MSFARPPRQLGDSGSHGRWTIGWVGQDPFGRPVWAPLDVMEAVQRLTFLICNFTGINTRDHLSQLSVDEILAFDEQYTRASQALYSWAGWRAADIMIGDASDDVFADFRSWVISRGRKAYEHIVAWPDEGLAELDLDAEAEQISDGELLAP